MGVHNQIVLYLECRKHDHENFLTTLLIPEVGTRKCVFALRALNVEVALIRDQVSMRETGLGRLAFWRNSINELFKAKTGAPETRAVHHPVILELSRVLPLPKKSLGFVRHSAGELIVMFLLL